MKRILSAFTSIILAAFMIIPSFDIVSASAAEYSKDGFTLTYTTYGDNASITDCSGNGTELVIPDKIGQYTVAAIAPEAFAEMSGLVSVSIPDSVISIADKAFWNCPSLKSVNIGSSIISIGIYAFSACPRLNAFTVSESNNSYRDINGMLYSKDGSTLVYYAGESTAVIPNGTKKISRYAFFGNTLLSSVNLPSGLVSIGDYAFSGCFSLGSVSVPDSVTELGTGCFMNCTSMMKLSLGSGITEIPDDCFNLCTMLESVNIPNSVVKIGNYAFFSCGKLSGIYISGHVSSVGTDAIGMHTNIRSGKNEPYSDFYISGDKNSQTEKYAAAAKIEFIDFNNILNGDVDRNGTVDALDASMVLMEYANVAIGKDPSFGVYQSAAADYNKDGAIDALDASFILMDYANAAVSKT